MTPLEAVQITRILTQTGMDIADMVKGIEDGLSDEEIAERNRQAIDDASDAVENM